MLFDADLPFERIQLVRDADRHDHIGLVVSLMHPTLDGLYTPHTSAADDLVRRLAVRLHVPVLRGVQEKRDHRFDLGIWMLASRM